MFIITKIKNSIKNRKIMDSHSFQLGVLKGSIIASNEFTNMMKLFERSDKPYDSDAMFCALQK